MKFFGNRVLAVFILCVIGLLAAAVVVVRWPSVILNEKTLPRIARIASRAGVDLSWSTARVGVDSITFLKKHFDLQFTDLCYRVRGKNLSVCFKDADIQAVVDLSRLKPKIVEAGPINLTGGRLDFEPSNRPQATSPGSQGNAHLPGFLSSARVQPFRIEVDDWKARLGATALAGKLALHGTENAISGTIETAVDQKGMRVLHGETAFHLRNSHRFWEFLEWGGSIVARTKTERGEKIRLRASLEPRSSPTESAQGIARYDYAVGIGYVNGRRRATARINGTLDPHGFAGTLEAEGKKLIAGSEWLNHVRLDRCVYGLSRTIHFVCPVEVNVPIPPKTLPQAEIPTHLDALIEVNLAAPTYPFGLDSSLQGTVGVTLEPILTPLFHGEGHLLAQVSGRLSEFPKNWRAPTDAAILFRVPDFHELSTRLRYSAFAIPAPFYVLRGQVELGAQGRLDIEGGKIPLELNSFLRSSTQNFDLQTRGDLSLKRLSGDAPALLDLDVLLSEVRVELPKLNLGAPPRLLPDPRIHPVKVATQSKKAKRFSARIRIHTRPGHPISLISNLAAGPIPVDLDLSWDLAESPTGKIHVGKFPIELYRRQAAVEHFDIDLSRPMESSPVNGSVKVKYTDYSVTILILATAGKPTLQFESNPPLPQDQVYAVLLFGHPLDELDPDQTSSVGNTQAAVADSALGLASLYFLASTPVESVSYDSSTKLVSAKVRLAEGTSLNVGAGTGALQQIGIRKRLGPHWSLSTDLTRAASGSTTTTASAFLEWDSRY